MSGPRKYYAYWTISEKDKRSITLIYGILKNNTNVYAKEKHTQKYRKQTSSYQRGEGSGHKLGVWC